MSLEKPQISYRQWIVRRQQITLVAVAVLVATLIFAMGYVIGSLEPATVRWHYRDSPEAPDLTIKLVRGDCLVLEAEGLDSFHSRPCK